jgi:calpain-15
MTSVYDMLQNPAFDAFTKDPDGSENLKAAFEMGDLNGDGQMSLDEFTAMMDEYGIDSGSAEELFTAMDADGSGGVDFHEMVSVFVLANQPPAKKATTRGIGDSGGAFLDTEFPADESVVFGEADPTHGKPVSWERASEVFPGATLFDGIEPTDVCQGGLGDCWLLAAISALAEFPGAIEALFVTNRIMSNGKYTIKLFDTNDGWVEVIIDDLLAVMDAEEIYGPGYTFDGGVKLKPCFTSPNGNEIWVALLEKAVAKFCGSFGNLIGGQALYAWQIMTGCTDLWEYRKDGEDWQHVAVAYTDSRSVDSWSGAAGDDGILDSEAFWAKIMECDAANYVMGASCSGGVEDQLDTGLVTGHAYSMISCLEVDADGETHRMCCMRNPWGNDKEWNGKFSDTWGEWGSYPELASAIGWSDAPDGKFWMCYDDFLANWTTVSVAAKEMDTIRGTNNTTRGITMKAKKKFWNTATCGGNCSIM